LIENVIRRKAKIKSADPKMNDSLPINLTSASSICTRWLIDLVFVFSLVIVTSVFGFTWLVELD
jgi:hypothetical protein